jgi:hypothetical protein
MRSALFLTMVAVFVVGQLLAGKAILNLGLVKTIGRKERPRDFWLCIAGQVLVAGVLAYLIHTRHIQ